MELAVSKSTSSNAATQTDFVNSPILWQCLYVLQNMPEFRNLTYRITKTWNEVEMIMVYREGVVGVFGPPVDTITLTLDPKGKCLLSIPFKPVQRVSIVSPENAHIEIASLLALLRMVAGKGYLFCPGLPERFLAGKACGKFVVLHKVPFKRYQSLACPVYYQAHQETNSKSSLCALCPRCMQAAKWVQSLPYFSANGAAKTLQQPAQLAAANQQQLHQRNANQDISTKSSVLTQAAISPGCILPPAAANGLMSHGPMNNGLFTPASCASEILNIYQNSSGVHQKIASMDVNGNSQIAQVSKNNNSCISGQIGNTEDGLVRSVNDKLLERKSFLRSLLQERSKNKFSAALNLKTEATDGETSFGKANEQSNNTIKKGKQRHKNICHYCKKTFSTPANLMNHFQRHEAVSGSWQKQFKERRLKKNQAKSSSPMRMLFWRLKSLLFQHGKRPAHISETTLRLLLKYLDDLVPFQNGAATLKQVGYAGIKQEINQVEKKVDIHNTEKAENEALDKQYSLKRNSSGRSVMQALLEAAAIAGADQEHVSSPTVSSSSSVGGKTMEGPVGPMVSQTPPTPTIQMELEAVVPEKRPRKNSKPASKRVSSKNRKANDKDVNSDIVITKSAGNSTNHSFLTNLNLLSDVSLQSAELETLVKTEIPVSFSHKPPTSLCPIITRRSVSHTSPSPSSCQLLPNNTTSEINASLIQEPKANSSHTIVNGSNTSVIPHLPPLLFALAEPGTSTSFIFPSQKQQGQSQFVSPTSSLRHSMTLCEKQPVLSSLVAAPRSTTNSNSDCGAIDLSKPKPSQSITNLPLILDKKLDVAVFSGLPHGMAQMTTYENTDIASHLKRATRATDVTIQGHNETQPVTFAAGRGKSARSDIQLSATGNTRSTKGRKGTKNTGHLHTVIDTSSRSSLPGDSSSVQSDEIHCSYKWTGSGGMVKEHTQMFRELVPSHVMANFLSKPWSSSAATQPINVSLYNSYLPQIPSPQMEMSKSEEPTPVKPPRFSVIQAALNLSKGKPVDVPVPNNGVSGSSKKPTVMMSTSAYPVSNHTSSLPSSTTIKSSNGQLTGITNCLPASTDVQDHPITSSPLQMQFKDMNVSRFSNSSSFLAAHTSPTCMTLPSPSLPSVSSQRVADKHEHSPCGKIGNSSQDRRLPAFLANKITDISELSYLESSYIKREPVYLQNSEPGMITMTLPVKEENVDREINKDWNKSTEASDCSPPNLVLDMSPDSTTSKDEVKALALEGHFISEQADLISQKGSLVRDS